MTLRYKDVSGITKVNVGLTIDGEEAVYPYDVTKAVKTGSGDAPVVFEAGDVKQNGNWREIFLSFVANGQIDKVKISFEGEGTITLQELRFNMDQNSGLDFSGESYINHINARDWDGDVISYDNHTSSATLTAWYKETIDEEGNKYANSGAARYYFGAMIQGNGTKVGEGNIDISNKSQIIVIYSNQSSITHLTLGLGLTDITDGDGWKEVITQAYDITSGKAQTLTVESNMAEGEWAAIAIDLSAFENLTEGTVGKAITQILLHQTNASSKESIQIRAVIVL